MLERLKEIAKKHEDLVTQQADPEIAVDPNRSREIAQKLAELGPVVTAYREYSTITDELAGANEIVAEADDDDMRQMAEAEVEELNERCEKLEEHLKLLLLPVDPNDRRNVILEIRAGTGGDEAALFAGELLRMYGRYAEGRRWKLSLTDSSDTGLGGIKEAVVVIEGEGAYSRLKYESGVHRVQRVPETETQGRIHTSAATVVVLPEVESVEVDIDPNDLRIDVFRASGHGGQHVNTTDSAVRIVHLPTGIMATCQDEKSQYKNKAKAMKVLMARIYDLEMQKQQDKISSQRRSMIRSGDRSEKIRTYNYPQGRVTDHRINLTLYRLNEIMEGDLDMLIDELQMVEQEEKLKIETEQVS